MQLEMSDEEICSHYKRNGGGKKMISILAQLNAADDVIICEILEKNGLLKSRPKRLRAYYDYA